MTRCPVCADGDTQPVVHLRDVPVFCNVLWPDVDAARNAIRGDIDLVYCSTCTHLFNRAFDAARADYTPAYENSLHFSPRFEHFARALSHRLTERYGLRGGSIVDVGCGRGDFLRMICGVAEARGLGFDRSHGSLPESEMSEAAETPEAPEASAARVARESAGGGGGADVRLVDDFLYADTPRVPVDLLTCRHVLEHVSDPVAFLAGLATWLEGSGAVAYLEVPNAAWTIQGGGIWDLIYEHVSYFTAGSLTRAMQRAGFEVVAAGEAFGHQYLHAEARVAVPSSAPDAAPGTVEADGHGAMGAAVRAFAHRFRAGVAAWRARLDDARSRGERIAVWGSGSKGVTFLNLVAPGGAVRSVIDINPRKHGRYVPGTGHRVVGPEVLASEAPDRVIVMNPLYVEEIRTDLRERGIVVPIEAV